MEREAPEIPVQKAKAVLSGDNLMGVENEIDVDREFSGNFTSEPAVAIYLRDITRIPLLTPEQVVDLAKQRDLGNVAREKLADTIIDPLEQTDLEELVHKGEEARKKLIESNLRLVVSVAQKYTGRGLDLIDLIQEGNIGLSRASDKFEWQKGCLFSTYAFWWIRQGVSRAIADQARTIRLPGHMIGKLTKIGHARDELTDQLERLPTTAEIADRLGTNPEDIRKKTRAALIPVSYHTLIGDDGESILGDLISDHERPFDEEVIEVFDGKFLRKILSELTPRKRLILEGRFGLGYERDDYRYIPVRPKTLEEIAEEIGGITRERVRQLEAAAIQDLRRNPNAMKRLRSLLLH